jgi:hypothetical protein
MYPATKTIRIAKGRATYHSPIMCQLFTLDLVDLVLTLVVFDFVLVRFLAGCFFMLMIILDVLNNIKITLYITL